MVRQERQASRTNLIFYDQDGQLYLALYIFNKINGLFVLLSTLTTNH